MRKYIFALAAALLVACPVQAAVLTNTVTTNNTVIRTATTSLVTTSAQLEKTSMELETRAINPQPEPPKEVDLTPVTENQAVKLNTQSISTVGTSTRTETEYDKEGVQDSIDSATQRVMLNPQPEPPAPANLLEDKTLLENKITGDGIPNFAQIVKLDGQVEMKNAQALYTANGKSYGLKSMPSFFYQKLTANLARLDMGEGSVRSMELKMEKGKPVYEIQVSEPVKWFGLFKGNIDTRVTVAADKEEVQAVKRPWYSFLLAVSDIKKDLELLPNLRVSALKITPANYKEGDNIKIEATVINDGPGFAAGGCDLFTGGGLKAAMYVDGYPGQWYCVFLALQPGETMSMTFHWDGVKCGHKLSAKIDTSSHMEETDENDNELAMTTCQ